MSNLNHQIALIIAPVSPWHAPAPRSNDDRFAPLCPARHRPGRQTPLPAPFATPSARNQSKVIGWPQGKNAQSRAGLRGQPVRREASTIRAQAYVLPNGDILVVEATREWPGRADRPEKSANRITLFRDTNGDGKPDLARPFSPG